MDDPLLIREDRKAIPLPAPFKDADHDAKAASALLDFVGLLGLDRLRFGGIVRVLEAFLEVPDAMGEIAHQSGNLALATKQKRNDRD
jgi:hypothetical protein